MERHRRPPLTRDEYQQLMENIISEGVVLMPLIVWNGTIVDGHNRYKIVQEHPEIIFSVHEKDFDNRYEALVWICNNQLGRRNLTPVQKKMLVGDRYEAEKQAVFFHGNQYTSSCESGGGQIGHHQNTEKTRERIAAETGTSESYVKRAIQFAQGATAAEEVSPGFRQEVLSGKVKPTQKEMWAVPRAPRGKACLHFHFQQKGGMPLGRRKKLINNTDIPQYEIEKIARCLLPDILAYYDSEEGQREFAVWKAQWEQTQAQDNDT